MIRTRTATTALRSAARSLTASPASTSTSSSPAVAATPISYTLARPYASSAIDNKDAVGIKKQYGQWTGASQLHQDHHHDDHHHHAPEPAYHAPTGWLWGIRPGEKSESEGWEIPMAIFVAAFAGFGIALAFKPNDRLDTWALEEARRRLEKEGILEDPKKA
jgi:hypothetical protein